MLPRYIHVFFCCSNYVDDVLVIHMVLHMDKHSEQSIRSALKCYNIASNHDDGIEKENPASNRNTLNK